MTPAAYLERIGYTGQPVPDLATLHALHLAHLRAVPFENLDIHAAREIVLDEAALYAKIVGRRRGGICYELNATFAWLLRAIGFHVTLAAANVHVGESDLTPDFDHMVLIVDIDGARYLADVGFGESFLLPLALEQEQGQGAWQNDGAADYGIVFSDGLYTVVRANAQDPEAPPQRIFRFADTPRALADFTERCDFHQHSAETHFRRRTVCSRATLEGRITLRGSELTIVTGTGRTVMAVAIEEQIEMLYQHFGFVQDIALLRETEGNRA
jgi:N-hydroxyarylamine O-acetyltransferase